jgi:hypothetical protein
MQKLEQQCWRFLMSAINSSNCNQLHELADRYDCPPLKLAAFRALQEQRAFVTGGQAHVDNEHSSLFQPGGKNAIDSRSVGTGLTGPGEVHFYSVGGGPQNETDEDRYLYDGEEDDDDDEDEQEQTLSILGFLKRSYGEEPHSDNASLTDYVHPAQLPPDADARDVIKAWSARLHEVYLQCIPEDGEHYMDHDNYLILDSSRQVKPANSYYSTLSGPGDESKGYAPTAGAVPSGVAPPTSSAGGGSGGLRARGAPTEGIRLPGVNWKHELKRFYLGVKMPDKVNSLDEILANWVGREDQMIISLVSKYRKVIPPALMEHLTQIQSKIETQTESSFRPQNQ